MVKRHSYPTNYDGCEISIATERMKDGKWSVVASIEHHVGDGVQTTPMPVTHLRFARCRSHERPRVAHPRAVLRKDTLPDESPAPGAKRLALVRGEQRRQRRRHIVDDPA